jgi:hypothetical protein
MDLATFREVILVAHNAGMARVPLQMWGRDKLIDSAIEGRGGLLEEKVDTLLARHLDSAKLLGASIIFDGAKDANGVSVEVFMMQTMKGSFVAFSAHPQSNSKTSAWLARQLRGLLSGRIDYSSMEGREVDADADSDIDQTEASEGSPSKRLKSAAPAEVQLCRLLDISKYVWAAGSDNASTPVKAVLDMEKATGLVPFGDVSHAFSRCYMHILDCEELKVHLEMADRISDLFLTYQEPRALLRGATRKKISTIDGSERFVENSGKSPKRLVGTRFVSAAAVLERLLEIRPALEEVVAAQAFKSWRAKLSLKIRQKISDIINAINSPEFWLQVNLINKLSLGFVVAVRLFDGAWPGSACLVNKVWSMLAGTVGQALCDPEFKEVVSLSLFDKVRKIIEKDWQGFHFPVFAAAQVGCVHLRDELVDMVGDPEDSLYLRELKTQTLSVCRSMLRRFDLEKGMNVRPEPLEVHDESVVEALSEIELDIEDYLGATGKFDCVEYKRLGGRSAASWWQHKAPPCKLSTLMTRICALSPSSTPVEREHKKFKAVRTKYRNRLGYLRALGLAVIASQSTSEAEKNPPWEEIMRYKDRFDKLSSFDRAYLDNLHLDDGTSSNAMDILKNELDEEGLLETAHTLLPASDAPPDDALRSEDALDLGGALAEREPAGPAQPVSADGAAVHSSAATPDQIENESTAPASVEMQQLRSSRGRIVRKRIFDGFEMTRWGNPRS